MQARPGGKSCFSHTNASNFRQPLKSLLLRYTMKILRLPNFNMLFQLVLTTFFKSELFSCLLKVDHVIKSCKEPVQSSAKIKPTSNQKNQDFSCTHWRTCVYGRYSPDNIRLPETVQVLPSPP